MKYAYLRVSSADQNVDRQLAAVREYWPNIEHTEIFIDKQSGKNFERPQYLTMKALLKAGDEVVVKELDRLGRNKDGVKGELAWFKTQGVTIRILELATTLTDFQGLAWVGEMVNSILIEVMSSMAEQERIKIGQRQTEGIASARQRGIRFGRPAKPVVDFEKIAKKQKDGEITVPEACRELGISKTQWYRLMKTA